MLRLAVHPCRKVRGKQSNGKPLHCFSIFREVTDSKTVCANCGSPTRGKFATLANKVVGKGRKSAKRTTWANKRSVPRRK